MDRTRLLTRGSVLPLLLQGCLLAWPATVQAAPVVCDGTRLDLSVRELGDSPIAHFRFSLRVSGEGNSEQQAMQQLNRRLMRLRQELQGLVQGGLTVSAPRSSPRGSREARQFTANTGVSGHLSPANFNAFIQSVGVLPGVRQQGMRSMADAAAERQLQQRLLTQAIQRGQAEAMATARVIGAGQVKLLSIRRGGSLQGPRPLQLTRSAEGFDPQQAPEATTSVDVQLAYCLS